MGMGNGVDGRDVYIAAHRHFFSSSLVHGDVAMCFEICNYCGGGREREGWYIGAWMAFAGERNE
jgi:hypothetical protein